MILTVGTRGDIQPYVALGKGLVLAGHEVQICSCQRYQPFIESHGIGYAYLNNDILEFIDSEDGRRAMEDTTNLLAAIRTGLKLWSKIGPMTRRQIDEMGHAVVQFRPDLILFHKKAIGAEDFAEQLGCRCALAFYLPMYVPTDEFPAFGMPRLFAPGYNRATYRLIEWVTRISSNKFLKPWRVAQGLSPKRRNNRRNPDDTPIAALHAYSRHVIPQPSDWPASAIVTGYWFLDEQANFEPSQQLGEFLEQGPPPIYVGFGSIFGLDPKAKTKVVIEGIRRSGARAILASGWGGLDLQEFDLPKSMLAIKSAPHDWLFPKVSAVVHHGGCGTTAAGLRAGRPSVICPFFGDQPYWGAKIHSLGVGPKPIPQKKLTAERLSNAILQATTDLEMQQRARDLGKAIRQENGVASAVAFIEKLAKS